MTLAQRQAIVTALATTCATLAAFALHVENPWWASISAFVVCLPSTRAMLAKATYRVVGTFAGCLLAGILSTQLAGNPLIIAIATLALFTMAVYKRYTAQYSYAWFLGALTAGIFMVVAAADPEVAALDSIIRAVEICIGVVVATIVTIVTEPFVHTDGPAPPDPAPPTDRATHIAALQVGLFGGVLFIIVGNVLNAMAFPAIPQVLASMGVMLSPSIETTRRTARNRAMGCLIGGLTGIIFLMLSIDQLALWAFVYFGVLAIFAVHHHSGHPDAYVGTQAAYAFIVATVTGLAPTVDIAAAIHRVAGIVVTAIFIGIMSWLIVPWIRGKPAANGREDQKTGNA